MTAATDPRLQPSLGELRAAWSALEAGAFLGHTGDRWRGSGHVAVVGAHGHCGASTVALAIAEAPAWPAAHLVEFASTRWSGLFAATETEVGEAPAGWRRGRRGTVIVDHLACLGRVEDAAPQTPPGACTTVVDLAALARGGDWFLAGQVLAAAALVVVATTATVPGMRHLEAMVEALPATDAVVAIAVLGAPVKRWPRTVAAAAPAAVRAMDRDGRVVVVPTDPTLAVTGLTPDPLPRPVRAAAMELLRLIPSAEDRKDSE